MQIALLSNTWECEDGKGRRGLGPNMAAKLKLSLEYGAGADSGDLGHSLGWYDFARFGSGTTARVCGGLTPSQGFTGA